jgi:hypothetical protein
LARLQAEEGPTLTTLMQTQIEMEDENARQFLKLLDGSRDRQTLARWLSAGTSSLDSSLKQVNDHLEQLRRLGLLIDNVT